MTSIRMKWIVALLCLGAGTAGDLQAKTPIAAVVTATIGKPRLQPEGESGFFPIKKGQNVYEGDVLKTGKSDEVALVFVGGAEVRINANSRFQVDSGGGSKPTSIFSELGQAWTQLIHGGAEIDIHSPTAVCAVRGTVADVDINSGGMTAKFYEGHGLITTAKGQQPITAGQMASVAAGAAPSAPQSMSQGQMGTWQNALKPTDVQQMQQQLLKQAEQERVLEIKSNKNGKQTDIKLHFKKKDQGQ